MKKKSSLKSQHVVKHNKGWAVKKGGASKASKVFIKQTEAFNYGRKVSINQKAELFVHGRNGRIRLRNSYGNDNHPPLG